MKEFTLILATPRLSPNLIRAQNLFLIEALNKVTDLRHLRVLTLFNDVDGEYDECDAVIEDHIPLLRKIGYSRLRSLVLEETPGFMEDDYSTEISFQEIISSLSSQIDVLGISFYARNSHILHGYFEKYPGCLRYFNYLNLISSFEGFGITDLIEKHHDLEFLSLALPTNINKVKKESLKGVRIKLSKAAKDDHIVEIISELSKVKYLEISADPVEFLTDQLVKVVAEGVREKNSFSLIRLHLKEQRIIYQNESLQEMCWKTIKGHSLDYSTIPEIIVNQLQPTARCHSFMEMPILPVHSNPG